MSGLAVALALAAQVVTLEPAVIAERAVYVRVAVGTDSRIAIADGMVRVHGQHATADLLGLKLGYARPTTLLLLHPRGSGLGEIKFVGLKHTMRLRIEASTLGEAQDLEIRISESEDNAKGPEPSNSAPPRTQVTGSSSVAPQGSQSTRAQTLEKPSVAPKAAASAPGQAQTPKKSSVAPKKESQGAATARSAPPQADGYPGPPPPRPAPEPERAPEHEPQPQVATPDAPAPTLEATGAPPPPTQPAASATTGTCPTGLAPTTRRLMRRIGRPGQRGILLEEMRREGAQVTLRARVEGAAHAQFVQLALGAFISTLAVDRDGRDLVLSGTVIPTPTLPVRNATLVIDFGGHWETARFRLPEGGTL